MLAPSERYKKSDANFSTANAGDTLSFLLSSISIYISQALQIYFAQLPRPFHAIKLPLLVTLVLSTINMLISGSSQLPDSSSKLGYAR